MQSNQYVRRPIYVVILKKQVLVDLENVKKFVARVCCTRVGGPINVLTQRIQQCEKHWKRKILGLHRNDG